MFKVLFVGFSLFITFTLQAQTYTASNGAVIISNDIQITGRLTTIAQFASYYESTTQISVSDPVRGGVFNLYTGSDAADNGMVFSDSLGRKWLRQTSKEGNTINAQWYGAVSDGSTDNRPVLLTALAYIKSHPAYRVLYLPVDSTIADAYNKYRINDSIVIDFSVTIKGDGVYKNPRTKIQFPAATTGFIIKYPNGANQINVSLEGLRIDASYIGTFDITKHCIVSNTIINLKNIVIDNYDGDGVHISACAAPPTGDNNNYGNASFSKLDDVSIHYTTNGLFIEGCDASVMTIQNCDFSQVRRWGVYDNGFLGNHYNDTHFAVCGSPAIAGSNSVVIYGGKYYMATPGYDGYFGDAADSNYNKQPDISPLYWKEIGAMSSVAWNDTTRYYSGGPACIRNANAFSGFTGCYTESFQPPIYLNPRSYVDGGDIGTGVFYGIFRNVVFGQQYLNNGDLIMPGSGQRQTIGTDAYDAGAVMTIKQNTSVTGGFTGISVSGDNAYSQLYNTIKENLGGNRLAYGLNYDNYRVYMNSNQLFEFTSTALNPGTDNTYDIGSSGLKWKNGYYVNLFGGSLSTSYLAKTTNYNISSTDYTINVTSNSNSYTLPTAVGITGKIYVIKNSGSGSPVINTTSSQTIDGSTTYSLSALYKYITVQSDGANWIIIGNN